MNDSQKTEPGAAISDSTSRSSSPRKKKTEQEKIEARLQYKLARKAPAAPLMLNTFQAWKRLCAKTGCSISMYTFVGWIRAGKVVSIRLGGKIFVPIAIVDDLVQRCFTGEPLI